MCSWGSVQNSISVVGYFSLALHQVPCRNPDYVVRSLFRVEVLQSFVSGNHIKKATNDGRVLSNYAAGLETAHEISLDQSVNALLTKNIMLLESVKTTSI